MYDSFARQIALYDQSPDSVPHGASRASQLPSRRSKYTRMHLLHCAIFDTDVRQTSNPLHSFRKQKNPLQTVESASYNVA